MVSKRRVFAGIVLGVITILLTKMGVILAQLILIRFWTTDPSLQSFSEYTQAIRFISYLNYATPFLGGFVTGLIVQNRSSYWGSITGIIERGITLVLQLIIIAIYLLPARTTVGSDYSSKILVGFGNLILISPILILLSGLGGFFGGKLQLKKPHQEKVIFP